MAFTETTNNGLSNSTTDVTLVDAPAANTRHIIKHISIHNADTAAATVEVMYDDGTNQRTILKVALAVGDNLIIDDVIVLDTTLKSLKFKLGGAITTNQLPFVAHYSEVT